MMLVRTSIKENIDDLVKVLKVDNQNINEKQHRDLATTKNPFQPYSI